MKYLDISNRTFGQWTVLSFGHTDKYGSAHWLCRCECGKVKTVHGSALRTGKSQRCSSCSNKNKEHPVRGTKFVTNEAEAIFTTDSGDMFKTSLCDAKRVSRRTWCLAADGYFTSGTEGRLDKLHQFIFGHISNGCIDHKNGDKTDNRRENLRHASFSENSRNARIPKNNTSGYKGVSLDRRRGTWKAVICYQYKPIYLGAFLRKEDAALRYNKAAKEFHGEFACLNPIGVTKGYRTTAIGEENKCINS